MPCWQCLIINQISNGPKFLTILHNLPIRSSGAMITLALSISSLGVSLFNPVLADSHPTTPPTSGALSYESALTGYKTLDGDERSSWKESNDTVGQIGGWRSYAKEAYQANQAEADAKSDAEARIEDEALESSVVTKPAPDSTARRMDSAEMASMTEASELPVAKRAITRPLSISYQSATTDYRLYDDNPPGDWQAANDRVREIGGWRTYAKEAYEATKRKAQTDAESGSPQ